MAKFDVMFALATGLLIVAALAYRLVECCFMHPYVMALFGLCVLIGTLLYPNKRICTYMEIIDLPFVPKFIKNFLQDNMFWKWRLAFAINAIDGFIGSTVSRVAQECKVKRLIALGAGGGGLEPFLYEQLRQSETSIEYLELTDLMPNVPGWEKICNEFGKGVSYSALPIDATAIPRSLDGIRIFTAMIHHFPPHMYRAILQDAVNSRQPIIVVDGKPTFINLILLPIQSFVLALTSAVYHLLAAFRAGTLSKVGAEVPRLLCTACLVLPLIQSHDMAASVLRFYGEDDVKAIVSGIAGRENYTWEYHFNSVRQLTVLVGIPHERGRIQSLPEPTAQPSNSHALTSTLRSLCWQRVKHVLVITRLTYHLNFLVVVAGALWKPCTQSLDTLLAQLVVLYCSFGLLFYTGIYCLNAYADYDSDAVTKPWRTQYWSRSSFAKWSVVLLVAGLASVLLIPVQDEASSTKVHIGYLYCAFLGINIAYSACLSRLPSQYRLVKAGFIAVTCPLRVVLGLMLAQGGAAAFAFAADHLVDLACAQWFMFIIHYLRGLGGARPNKALIACTCLLPVLTYVAHGSLDVMWSFFTVGLCGFILPAAFPKLQTALESFWW